MYLQDMTVPCPRCTRPLYAYETEAISAQQQARNYQEGTQRQFTDLILVRFRHAEDCGCSGYIQYHATDL